MGAEATVVEVVEVEASAAAVVMVVALEEAGAAEAVEVARVRATGPVPGETRHDTILCFGCWGGSTYDSYSPHAAGSCMLCMHHSAHLAWCGSKLCLVACNICM